MKNKEKIIKTGSELLQDKLLKANIETEITEKVALIRSVMIHVLNMLLEDNGITVLHDIRDHFDLEVHYFCSAYDKLINIINERDYE